MMRPAVAAAAAALGAVLALGGCAGSGASVPSGQGAAVAGQQILAGVLVWRERIVLPEAAEAHVQMVRFGPGGTVTAVLGETTVGGPMTAPVPFRLSYSPGAAAVPPGERVGLVAMVELRGETLFTSLVPIAVPLPVGQGGAVAVPLFGRWGMVDV